MGAGVPMTYDTSCSRSPTASRGMTLNRPERLNSFTTRCTRSARRARQRRRRRAGARAAADRRRARLLRRAGPLRPRGRAGRRAGRSRRVDRAQLQAAGARHCARCPCRSCARSTAWPPAPARTSRSPATSSSRARSASFIQAFCKIGLVPDSGGTYFLPRLVGTARAMGLALLGDKLSRAEQAAAWGLIWQCVDDAELAPRSRSLARAARDGADARARARSSRRCTRSADNTLAAQLDLERDLQRELGNSDDYREGVAAFMAKRPPRFTGR